MSALLPPATEPTRLDGNVALVTGGGQGIGEAIAYALSASGAVVVVAGLDVASCAAVADAIVRRGGAALALPLDVRDRDSCHAVVERAVGDLGRLDVLVNNAGITRRSDAMSTTDTDWHDVLDTNLSGTFRMCQEARPHLETAARPAIVNLGSTNGFIAVPDAAAYCVSKAGVLHLTRVLALEWAPVGIRVNAVAPTIVPSPMTEDLQSNADYLAAKLATIPLGRQVAATEVANTTAWLASPAASMITGQTIFVDGGVTIH
jgi:NAD(P)-dependent dehydrogenase (short-subunit alcohol dehydrogenase family)